MNRYLPGILFSVVITVAGVVALWSGTSGLRSFTAETDRRIYLQESSNDLTEFTIENHAGHGRKLTDSGATFQVIDFIYTRCPTVCRVMGSEFTQLQSGLVKRGIADKVKLVSISFDSENESQETLSAYLKRYRADTAVWQSYKVPNPEEESGILQEFGVTVIPDSYGGYVHNAAFYLVQDNKITGIYDYTDTSTILATLTEQLSRL